MNPLSRTLSTLVLCLLAVSVAAQNAPPPPTPYPSPVTAYVGRYLDSSRTASWQFMGPRWPRTLRADIVKVAPERDMLYMIVGSTFVGQKLSTYAHRVATTPHATIPGVLRGETYLPFEKWVDAERTPGWVTPFQDGQDRLLDFDWDDRGYIYLAYSVFGLGIIDADFQKVAQVVYPDIDILPSKVIAFRNGASYYALANGGSAGRIYDVTTPSAPILRFPYPTGFRDASRSTDGRIALVRHSGELHVHTPATILSNAAPLYTAPLGGYRQVTTDGTNFYALRDGGRDIRIFQPSGETYTDVSIPSFNNLVNQLIDYGAGYLTVVGNHRGAIYRVDGSALTLLDDGQYLFDWLQSLNPDHPFNFPRMLLPVFDGSQTLFVAALSGLGDVFTMSSQPPLTVAAQFSPATIVPSGTSLLTVTFTNPNPVPLSFSLDNAYPAHVFNTGISVGTTCGTGILSAAEGTASFQLTNATIGASSACTVTVQVTSAVPGNHTNTIPAAAIASADNSNTAATEAALVVDLLDAPQVQKSFATSTAPPGVPVRMTITLTNPNALAIEGLAFTDNYPATLINATPVNALNTCGGILSAVNGGASLSLSGGTIPASQSCTVALDVLTTEPGTVANTLPEGSVTSDNANASSAAATATFIAAHLAAIPTLSEWALLAMFVLLAAGALLRLR
ncbi:MAG: DUF7933 domain-containing protein [Thermoanaerobaculia bacterium]